MSKTYNRSDLVIMTFKATDRCDRCMAQAVASADAPGWASSLLFCGHHLAEHALALVAQGAVIYDPRAAESVR